MLRRWLIGIVQEAMRPMIQEVKNQITGINLTEAPMGPIKLDCGHVGTAYAHSLKTGSRVCLQCFQKFGG